MFLEKKDSYKKKVTLPIFSLISQIFGMFPDYVNFELMVLDS